jgi:phage-related protein
MAHGVTSRFSKSIAYKKKKYFEFRTTISDDREFRIFYIQGDEGVIFLYPLIKKTGKTPDSILEIIEDLAKRYR